MLYGGVATGDEEIEAMLIKKDDASLLVVDIQERLAPHMAETDRVVANSCVLLDAAKRLGVPVLVSEQYPRGLGPTEPAVAAHVPDGTVVEKVHFSCVGEPGFPERLGALGRRQAVVCGIEAHVCVLQTVEDLLARGTEVFVVADATSSRTRANHDAALERMRASGARVVTTEMVVFEWLEKAGTPEFKELSALIK